MAKAKQKQKFVAGNEVDIEGEEYSVVRMFDILAKF
jgi:co-chaperonin GroES (HSP10)